MSQSIAIGRPAAISYHPRPMPRRSPARFASAPHEPRLSRAARRAAGVYYTPPEIARHLAELTLAPMLEAAARGRESIAVKMTGAGKPSPQLTPDPVRVELPAIQILDPA